MAKWEVDRKEDKKGARKMGITEKAFERTAADRKADRIGRTKMAGKRK